MGILDKFLELQKIDNEIFQIRKAQERLPRQLTQQYSSVQEAKNNLKDKEEAIKKMHLDQRDREASIATAQSNIVKKETQRNTVKTNKEYSTLTEEIDQLNNLINEHEEYVLKIMEQLEQEAEAKKQLQEEVAKAEAVYEDQKKETQKELQELEVELKEIEQKRQNKQDELEKEDDAASLLQRYNRILTSRPRAIVPLEEKHCTSCYMNQLTNDYSILLSGKIIPCKGCGSLLYVRR